MYPEEQIAQLTEGNQRLVATLREARDMLLELRPEVERMEARERFFYLLRQRRWRLGSLRQQLT